MCTTKQVAIVLETALAKTFRARQGTVLQLAEKGDRFVGRGFSRDISAWQSYWALAPEGLPFDFFRNLFSRAVKRRKRNVGFSR